MAQLRESRLVQLQVHPARAAQAAARRDALTASPQGLSRRSPVRDQVAAGEISATRRLTKSTALRLGVESRLRREQLQLALVAADLVEVALQDAQHRLGDGADLPVNVVLVVREVVPVGRLVPAPSTVMTYSITPRNSPAAGAPRLRAATTCGGSARYSPASLRSALR